MPLSTSTTTSPPGCLGLEGGHPAGRPRPRRAPRRAAARGLDHLVEGRGRPPLSVMAGRRLSLPRWRLVSDDRTREEGPCAQRPGSAWTWRRPGRRPAPAASSRSAPASSTGRRRGSSSSCARTRRCPGATTPRPSTAWAASGWPARASSPARRWSACAAWLERVVPAGAPPRLRRLQRPVRLDVRGRRTRGGTCGRNPFGISALDLKALYLGRHLGAVERWAETSSDHVRARYPVDLPHTHRALDDAREQAAICRRIRDGARGARRGP